MMINCVSCRDKFPVFIQKTILFVIFLTRHLNEQYFMNKFYTAFFISLSFLLHQQAFSQQPVRFATGYFIPAKQTGAINTADLNGTLFSGYYHVLIQFDKIPSEQTKSALKKLGVDMDIYIAANSFLASISSNTYLNVLKNYGIVSIDALPALYKTWYQGAFGPSRSGRRQARLRRRPDAADPPAAEAWIHESISRGEQRHPSRPAHAARAG